ncbi:peptidoglycan editing factor PgeF [Gilliamella sp. B3781]|nr:MULTISPECIES: peptidoglycan editing factor PgeF [unclassified Gilliamella]MCX8641066.1 peptidoglycan editing factor PgeF [Gilliamella sp. B3835]MCX8707175.1 peptidoglycan editing factor PgeF [Gilliamella sp. B3783]MCX8709467.1 peptidoglycan editing factor PgeF [Gilliamella sp. B3780]MCX8711583.1 peptidoglycan editing factor PgeF [Gilliamella sp. B3468]MCX8715010.1 peptidoglycan editing factor PgeF [Gilliamella sp. B3781]
MIKSISPYWPAPKNIRAFTTTRKGGVSLAPFESLNLGSRTGDDLDHVAENCRRLIKAEQIPSEPYWLNQTHSTVALDITEVELQPAIGMIANDRFEADASYTRQAKQVSVVLTADCMPVLFCSVNGDEVAAAHAGWRGLCNGILEQTIKKFSCPKNQILAWMGPAISAKKFEVGGEVKAQFEAIDPQAEQAFTLINQTEQKYLADLYLIARQRLTAMGINKIFGGNFCTFTEQDLFFSYRRENRTGRMASMIWFENP